MSDEKPIDAANRKARIAQRRQLALSFAVGPQGTKEAAERVVERAKAYFAWLSEDDTEMGR